MSPSAKPSMFIAPPIFRPDGTLKLGRVLIANRGEIACRIIRTCRQQLMTTVAVFADEDKTSLHVQQADEAICIGPADAQPYQNIENLIKVAKSASVDAIHPGYGYLSENARFAEAVAAAGMVFIGPSPSSISQLGDKRLAKEYLAEHSSVPLIPGYGGKDQDPRHLEAEADRIGYPVLIKASAGGGGKGMRIVREKAEFLEAFLRCASEAQRSFGSGDCLLEKYIESGKHVEMQIMGDGETFVSLLDRECSIQRRHQKIIEESPCPWLSSDMRKRMSDSAIEIARLLKYESAGTVEFIVDIKQEEFYFLEVNTRIQVEHPITEEVTGFDIVGLQLFVAAGGKLASLPELATVKQAGHAIEVRLCAENPFQGFLPCTGTVSAFKTIAESLGPTIPYVRYELGVQSGSVVSVHFDSMISKIVVWSPSRKEAIRKMIVVLRNTTCLGVVTNQLFLLRILGHRRFQTPDYTTGFVEQEQQQLLQPIETSHVEGPMLIAAVLFDQQSRKLNSGGATFASIPSGFRNQHRDKGTGGGTFVACQLQLLGHEVESEVMVTRGAADEFKIAVLEAQDAPTAAETQVFFNRQGGLLTRRFYHARKSEPRQVVSARLLSSSPAEVGVTTSAKLQLLVNETQYTFEVALLGSDEFKKEVAVFSRNLGCAVHYDIKKMLSWAGKFDERGRDGGISGSDGKRKYLSPMPCHILQILAPDGSTVKAGDGLLVMESMKTEIRINAEAAGVVKMNVEQGSKISEGVVMCEVAAPESTEGGE